MASFMDANSELWKHERWFESYPMDTPAERVAGLGAACSYWHSCWETAIQERDEARAPYHECVSLTYMAGDRAEEALLRIRKALEGKG